MAIKYVRATGGSDSNNGSSFALGWATLAWAFNGTNVNRIAAGDTLAVCGDTGSNVFTITSSIQISATGSLTVDSPFYFAGYDMSGNKLTNGNFVKITSSVTLTALFNPFTLSFIKFSNIYFDGGGSGKAASTFFHSGSLIRYITYDNCRFTNCSSYGVNIEMSPGVGESVRFFQCEIDHNGIDGSSGGLYATIQTRGTFYMIGCKVHDNNGFGIKFGDNGIFIDNLIYKNSGDGIVNTNPFAGSELRACVFENNVFFGNTGDGIDLIDTSWLLSIVNNIFRSNGGYGLKMNAMDVDVLKSILVANNCSYNNTSGHIDINSGVIPGQGNIYKNPLFVSETAGSEDFNLQTMSPCRSAGLNPLGY